MSSYAEVQTDFTDPDILAKALGSLGYIPRMCLECPEHLESEYDDDLSEIIVSKNQLSGTHYGVGFRRVNGKFVTVVNTLDNKQYGSNSQWFKGVKVAYAAQDITNKLKKQGFKAIQSGKKLANGKLEYVFVKA